MYPNSLFSIFVIIEFLFWEDEILIFLISAEKSSLITKGKYAKFTGYIRDFSYASSIFPITLWSLSWTGYITRMMETRNKTNILLTVFIYFIYS